MINHRFFLIFAAFLLVFLQTFCKQNNRETVENRTDSGQLERFERLKTNFAKDGLYQKFYANDTLAEEAHYLNDTLDGEQKFFLETGRLEVVRNFKHGSFEGPYKQYTPDGKLIIEQLYAHNALNGWSLKYYPNGQLQEKVMLKENEENGPFTEYYDNGKLKAEGMYSPAEDAPLEQGELKEYDSTGVLIRTANCVDGVCRTVWKKE